MKTLKFISAFAAIIVLQLNGWGQDYPFLENSGSLSAVEPGSGITSPVTVTVIYDNYVHTEGMTPDWGYSIVIEGLDKTVLFDTGTRPEIFRSNFLKTGIDAGSIDLLVFSHEHPDHVGGLSAFSAMKTGIPVVIPHSFTGSVISSVVNAGYHPLLIRDAAMICSNLYTSGEFDYQIAEQCLVLDTREGLVVMTGCAHPGIVSMLREIKKTFNKDIVTVFGGFHLMDKSKSEVEEIITGMKSLGVVRCGATHCTGDMQIRMFRDAFGENYFELGAGNKIFIN
jgi:7,8-dihydropterin-6-yl-methyl-4-(beta-D-ribofuranosyl)aminobenzene 5'-phosphate synthase